MNKQAVVLALALVLSFPCHADEYWIVGAGATSCGKVVTGLREWSESGKQFIISWFINPFQDQVGNLEIIFVKHEHVTVTMAAKVRRKQHLSITTCSVDAREKDLAIIEGVLPEQSGPSVGVEMITK